MKYKVKMFVCDYWNGKNKQEREKNLWTEREFVVETLTYIGFDGGRLKIENLARMAAEREVTVSKQRLLTGLVTSIEETA